MTVLTDDGWEDAYWNGIPYGIPFEDFLEYLEAFPDIERGVYDDEPTGQPWPGSLEARRWDYDAPGMREYDAEDDMEVE